MNDITDTKIIRAEEVKKFDVWSPPQVIGKSINADQIDAQNRHQRSTAVSTTVTAQSVEEIRNAAYKEGLAKGRADGEVKYLSEQKQNLDTLNKLLDSCQQQVGNFDQAICEQLVTLTIVIAKQVIRRELSVEPEQIMAVIREAINCLPPSNEKLILKLHPEDATIVREIYPIDNDSDRTWKIFEDPGMQRGGCIINSESSVVNADLDHRITTIVSQLLGDERSDD